MSEKSKIEWTNATWNAVSGCRKISPGCANCYAVKDARRMGNNPNEKVRSAYEGLAIRQHNGVLNWTGIVRTLPDRLGIPLRWKKPLRIFVNSQSDLFHEDVPLSFIQSVFETMKAAHWHTFQVLTKRAERLEEVSQELEWTPNVWQGVSVESADYAFRIDHLRRTGAKVKFLSVEPLLGPVPDLDLSGIDWVIVGGESGPRCRPMEEAWVLDIRDQCDRAGVSFFFKQWGGRNKKKAGRELNGITYDAMPDEGKFPLPVLAEVA